jgi:hypothetical protein
MEENRTVVDGEVMHMRNNCRRSLVVGSEGQGIKG